MVLVTNVSAVQLTTAFDPLTVAVTPTGSADAQSKPKLAMILPGPIKDADYNSLGYADPAIYPWLIVNQQYDPFYAGRNQVGLYVLVPKPFDWWDTTFIFSTLANLTDATFISRVDYSVLLLTYLRLEAYAAVRYGTPGGTFRFALDVPPIPDVLPSGVHIPPPVADFGVALRLSL